MLRLYIRNHESKLRQAKTCRFFTTGGTPPCYEPAHLGAKLDCFNDSDYHHHFEPGSG